MARRPIAQHCARQSRSPRLRRKGLETVEFALILPFIVTFGLRVIEFSRALTVQQVLTSAAREGAREAVLPNSTIDGVKATVVENLKVGRVDPAAGQIDITPSSLSGAKSGTGVTVDVRVPYGSVSWLPMPRYLGNTVLGSQCTMRHE